jgi:predicted lysophospholipase L1 biosynthesis ABC-type transport system permease subunit
MNIVNIARKNFSADTRSSDGRLSMFTQIVLIAFLLTLSLTSASIQKFLDANLENLLGADSVIYGARPLTDDELQEISKSASRIVRTQLTPIVITNEGNWQRVQLKLVSADYPLQGSLQTTKKKGGTAMLTSSGPAVGEVWVGSRLATTLSLDVGGELVIAEQNFIVSAILTHEPDRLLEGHSVAMRAMINEASIPEGNIQSSRHRYRYLLGAKNEQQEEIKRLIQNKLPDFAMIQKDGGGHPLSLFWKRTENFLGLASVILFFMAAIALDMTSQRFVERQKRRIALYLSFGESLGRSLLLSFVQWGIGYVLCLALGLSLAYGAEYLLITELAKQFDGIMWGLHPIAVCKAILLTMLLFIMFQVPAFMELAGTSITRLIRPVISKNAKLARLFWSVLSLLLLAAYYSDNPLLTALTLSAIGAAIVLMMVITWLVLTLGELWGRNRPGLLPFVFFLMKKRIVSKSSQILGLGLCCLLLLFTLMLMKDIGSALANNVRANDGNLVISEVSANERGAIESWARETDSQIRQLRPFTSAKLVRINDIELSDFTSKPSDTLATVQEPIRLSWSNTIPANNRLVDGKWWEHNTKKWQQISIEPEIMTDLGLTFGDTLTFVIEGALFDFELVSTHAYKAGGGSVTFWFQVPSAILGAVKFDTYFMGSMELPDDAWASLPKLWQAYPTLSLVSLREITRRYDDTLAVVTKLTLGFASMVLIMAAIVIAASVKGFEADDRKKNGLLLSMGLSKSACVKLGLYDWITVSLIASVGAIAGTWFAGYLIYEEQFSLTYTPNFSWLIGVAFAVTAVTCFIGRYYSQNSLKASINQLMGEN